MCPEGTKFTAHESLILAGSTAAQISPYGEMELCRPPWPRDIAFEDREGLAP